MKKEKVKRGMVMYDKARGRFAKVTVAPNFLGGVWLELGNQDDGYSASVKTLRPLTAREKGPITEDVLCGNCGKGYKSPAQDHKHGWNVCRVNDAREKRAREKGESQ